MQTLRYSINAEMPAGNFLKVGLHFRPKAKSKQTEFQLPAWRPGRYTLQNFVKNIRNLRFEDAKGNLLKSEKINKDRWEVQHEAGEDIFVQYEYFARQWDAGGCYFDDDIVYINWICLAIYPVGFENESCTVDLKIPQEYQIAGSLRKENNKLFAENFDTLVDSPIIASKNIHSRQYTVPESDTIFHLSVYARREPELDKWLEDFAAFTSEQLKIFGEIPTKEYWFLLLILPHQFYHGVEHLNSTVIALGPEDRIGERSLYEELLGVSCHELFHVWNVKAIRPKEMMPYRFEKENYFKTGFVAEGVTTYYGDYLLLRSSVFETEDYFRELNKMLKRWRDNYGRQNLSVADSSFDLWIDGYEQGIPQRKKSIYVDGCLAALILDMKIRRETNNQRSLDDLMRLLWKNFGQKGKGYSEKDYIKAAEKIAGIDLKDYFDELIYGTADFTPHLNHALSWVGCELIFEFPKDYSDYFFGVQLNGNTVRLTAPLSPAENIFSPEDEIIAIDGLKVNAENIQRHFKGKERLHLHFFRAGRLKEATMQQNGSVFFEKTSINFVENLTEEQRENFEYWAGLM